MHPVDRLRETRLLPVLIGIGAVALALFISEVASVLSPFLWAIITAYLLFPLVIKIENTSRLPRGVIVLGLYILLIGTLVVVVSQLGPMVISQVRGLSESLPGDVQEARRELIAAPEFRIGGIVVDTREVDRQIDEIASDLTMRFREHALPLVLHTVEILIHILVFLLATFYFLLHGDTILRQSRLLAPRRHRHVIDRVSRQVNATFGAYIRGQIILFVIMSVATYAALTVLQVDYRLALAVATGLLELVPIIGPWVAGSIAVTVALSQGHAPFGWGPVELGVAVGISYFVLRMAEDHLVIPQLIGRIVKVHPVLVIFAVLAGSHLFGILGLLLAVPVTAAAKIVIQAIYYELANPPPRHVFTARTSGELVTVRNRMAHHPRERVVLLIGPGAVDWDDLPKLQDLAMLAVEHDILFSVVTPDTFAASIATAAGIEVITRARFSDEVGTAELLAGEQQEVPRRKRFSFRSDPEKAEALPGIQAESGHSPST